MRRSRASLLLFFATFTSLLLAVGFADGGHESTGRPIDIYRLDIDEAAEGWHCVGTVGLAEDLLNEASCVVEVVADEGISVLDDWVILTGPGSPLTVALHLDEETACQLAYEAEAAAAANRDLAPPAAPEAEFAGCIFGPWPCNYAFVASLAAEQIEAADAMDWQREATAAREASTPITAASERLALDAAIAFGGLPHALAWNEAIAQASRCEFAWDELQELPAHTAEGWLAERAELPIAEFCRGLGQEAWTVLRWLSSSRDRMIAGVSAELAAWLPKLADPHRQAAIPSSHSGRSTTSAIRPQGALIAL
ncbi:MAG TPA: hypothetical protein VHD36_20100 [Pirellulales bacterium]|nr:hypothetical protein [Pirellulales bacterium]